MRYRITLIFIAIIILTGYLYFTEPDTVVVNEKGKVTGLVNNGRSLVQQAKFWNRQLKIAYDIYNQDIEPHLPSSNDMQVLYSKMRELERELDEKMKPLYTPEEQIANSLRIQADSVERAARWSKVNEADEAVRLKEIEKFRIIIPLIEAKVHGPKPLPALTH